MKQLETIMKHCNIHTVMYAVILTAMLTTTTVAAQQKLMVSQRTTVKDSTVCGLPITGINIKRNSDLISVAMDMQFADYKLTGDRVSVFSPVLINGNDSLKLAPVGIYSRIRHIQYLRYGDRAVGGEAEISYKYSNRPDTMTYSQTMPYAKWMNGATLYMHCCDYGCCNTLINEEIVPLAGWREVGYTPTFHYVTPAAEKEKMRELAGKAYIDFPVNMTSLYPDYRKNPIELAKIIATIDSVRNDKDVTVRRITIKGWASPESSWSNNTRLAKGRTATLKEYVQNLYRFPDGFIETDYYPEDWIGLREFVAQSGLEHKNEILALIDDPDIEPDPKEWKLKTTYPSEYKFLLATVYPSLRHSDYTIEYTIRQFNDPEEIRKVMATEPQKLSLEEMFVLARSLEPGSDEYNDVFETAVRMYPNDEVANLNAASAAMQRNDMANAEKYLTKAGTSDAAVYTRGIYAALTGDFDKAIELYRSVANSIPEASEALKEIEEIKNGN